MDDSRVLGTIDSSNDDPSGTGSRVFTSSGSMLTLHIKAEQGRDSFFLAEVRAAPDTAIGNSNRGIGLSWITGAAVIVGIDLISNNGFGIAFEDVPIIGSFSDVTVTGNQGGVYIQQTRGSNDITNLTCEGNRGIGVQLQLSYESYIHIFNSHIQENEGGGVSVTIGRYQHDQYPHIVMTNNNVVNNKRFALQASGKMAKFDIVRNLITQNICPYQPVVAFNGEPKYIIFTSNSLSENNARETFSILFEDQSEIGEKSTVLIRDNVFNENFYSPSETDGNFQYSQYPDPYSCTLEIGGYQENFTVIHNLIDNADMNHTLCSRVGTTFPDETIDAKFNWWGTADEQEIRYEIVDYDDWNDRAPVDYFPYLTGPDVSSQPADPSIRNITMTTDDIGGRLNGEMHLTKSGSPYTIKKDLTILENASVTVEPGVQIRFYPCIGIFNLGSFAAVGTETEQIEFHSEPSATHLYHVRLVNGRYPWEGRVEILYDNQWGGICYGYGWDSFEANVVCKELGYGAATTSVTTEFGRGPAWFHSNNINCAGDEPSIFNCFRRSPSLTTSCTLVGIRCNAQTSVSPRQRCNSNKWGGIRSNSQQEFKVTHAGFAHTGRLHVRLSSAIYLNSSENSRSISNLHIQECEGTGIHATGKSTYDVTNVTVRDCYGEAGISLERANRIATVTKSLIYNNTFYEGAITVTATRTASSSTADTRCGTPIVFSNFSATFASPNFGTSSYPTNSHCEWLIRAPVGHIIVLDFPIVDLGYNTQVTVYDGHDTTSSLLATYNRYSPSQSAPIASTGNSMFIVFMSGWYSGRGFLAKYEVDHFTPSVWRIVDNILEDNAGTSVKLTTRAQNSTIDVLRNIFENNQGRERPSDEAIISVSHERSNIEVRGNVLQNNRMTGILISIQRQQRSSVAFGDNRFRWNGRNTSLGLASVCRVDNNLFKDNSGTAVKVTSQAPDSLIDVLCNIFENNQERETNNGDEVISVIHERSNVVVRGNVLRNNRMTGMLIDIQRQLRSNVAVIDNMFLYGRKTTLIVRGRHHASDQTPVMVSRNLFSGNDATNSDKALFFDQAPGRVESNTFVNNSGRHVIEWKNRNIHFDEQELSTNFIYDNVPLVPGAKYTMVVSGRNAQIHGNVFTNPAFDAELATSTLTSSYPVNATSNFWGFSSADLISRRIRDGNDNEDWAEVLYDPWISVLPADGPCPLGWKYIKHLSTCYMYHGGSQDWLGAAHSCKIQHAVIARSFTGQELALIESMVRATEVNYASAIPIWKDRPNNMTNSTHECKIHLPSDGSLTMFADCGSFYPFVCKRPIVDDCPNACSHHGDCMGRTCICDRGWRGEDCSKATCNERNDCGEFGTCVGPNICRCRNGWQVDGFCKVWNEDQCPKGFIHPLYNDTTRIEKILIGHNVEYVPLEGNILYRCPVRFSSWGATMFVNEGDLDIRIGQVLSSPQANGVLHKVEQVIRTDNYTVIVAHPAALEDMLDYSDFSQEVQLEMAVDMKRNEGAPELSVVERVLSGNGTFHGSTVRVITEDTSVYKCIGARARNEGEGSYHLLMRDIPDHLSVGDVIVSNHSNGILEQVIQQTLTPYGAFIQTQLQDCFITFNFQEQLKTAEGVTLPASLPCSGGPEGAHGLLIVDSAGGEADVGTGDVVVGRRSGRLLAKVLNITPADEYTLVEVEPILSRSTMTMSSRRRREDVTPSPPKRSLHILIGDQFSYVTDSYSIDLSASARFSAGIKLSLAVSTSEFRTPTLIRAEVFFIGGRLEVGLEGSVDISESTRARGGFRTELYPIYVSLCVSSTACIPAKIWADIDTSYEIYAEGPGSIQMSSTVVKPDIDGGGSWQPQEGGRWFSFDQNEESDSADIVISSFSGASTEKDHLNVLELKVKPKFFIEFPTSGESEVDELTIPIDVNNQGDAFGYSITTSIQSQALLRVSAQSCSTECPYSDRPQNVGVTSSLDYLKGTFNVVVGNNDYYEEQQWRRQEWMDSDRDCKPHPSSVDTCEDIMCSCGGATGMPHPTNESFCMCPCNCSSGDTSFTHPDIDGCNCERCPDGHFKTVNSQGHLHCPCLCPDNSISDLTSSGRCDCSCTCPDGSRDVVLSDGSCPCKCTCNNCHESVLGPQGCICSDSCPDCENDEEPEWQDCVCKCPQKTECGIPPTCVVGRMGPDCRQPDCRPCQGCSGNGQCSTSTHSCQSSCVCWGRWFGDCCERLRPRPGGGDPHLQTLDGKSYDYHGIGEFWDCKSVSNDFGVQIRMYAYERASLIGGVAVKAGHSVVTLMTLPNATEKDVPSIRIDGELCQLSVGEKFPLNNGTIHLLGQQPSTNDTEAGAVIIISLTFTSGATVSFDVRYSPKMGRQFVNILFSPTATFKGNTEGLCGLMDDDNANDFTGPDGAVYNDSSVFAETWRINNTHHGSGLMGSWSWNSSNFHPDDVMDPAYSDPNHRPSVGIDGLTQEQKEKAEEMCIALGLTDTLLNECIFDVSITNDTTFTEQEVFKGCPNQCSGRGRCVNGTCDCITGWSGKDCNLGNCTDCSEDHGKCELGFCVCEPGWEGTACDQQATCYAVRNCTSEDHGICITTDACRCQPGYIGADCSKVPTCGNVANCTDHGVCVDYDTCLCDEQWTGDKCDQFSCAALDYCSGHGRCVDIDVCHCDFGWTGSSCITPECPTLNQCSRQGDCIGPNICQCYSGYQGLNCSEAQSCPELQECNENGVCFNNSDGQNECRCYPGVTGSSCDHPDCTKQNNCTNNGTCIEPNLCQCDTGYTGNDCANFSCESLQYCSGHGNCVSFDTCSCDPGWSGGSCNIANCSSKGDCSSQGTCVAPYTCECFPGFQGEDCSEEMTPNEHPPVFQRDGYDATIPENQPIGSPILTVFANDTDSGRNGEVRYRLAQTGLDNGNFAVHTTSGIITSVVDFDFESLEHTSFSFIVEAFDQGVPTLTGTATITINITDQNDHKPVINIPPGTEYNLQSISPIGFHVTTVEASDADRSDDNSRIAYGITSVSPFVSIDATNGSVTVSTALESGTYVVRVRASDHGSPPKTDEVTLRLIVTEVSTNTAPQCPENQRLEIASGNITRGSTITTIEADDFDNGPNGDISYSFKSKVGELASLFGIDPSLGRIYVETEMPLSNDTFSAVSMTVEARDNALDSMSCETNVIVIITFPGFSGTTPLQQQATTVGESTVPFTASTTTEAWYNDPIYISVICVVTAVVIVVVGLVIYCARKRGQRRQKYTLSSRDQQHSENAPPHTLFPRAMFLEEPGTQTYQNPVYNVED
ncbi:PREDICTED: uncharacterized protein LOC109487118 [Branchiostoma belcheri]|uniref:Uncharacterized protein LOC109487118 n=1 Tax=Branchiostoma belcheri TaxID=7741 RepID=A0A6P5AX71_BRABE|nr:PREDICTED: uncharacterized protein LOC109487118 [Branchiostoma belcheri]